MKRAAIAVAIAVSGIAAAAPAPAAEPKPDPAASRAGDANLESIEHRRGIVFGAALGPSVTIGGGTGTGGDVAFKLGHVATPSTVFTAVFGGSAQLHKNVMGELVANNLTYFLAGVQYWVGPSLWINAGVGGGTYHCNQCIKDGGPKTTRRSGVSGGFSAGVDLVRYRGVVLGLEVYSISVIDGDGLVMTGGMSLDLNFD